jgi:proteasome lid subunit RPN8/RPN11
LDAENEIKAWAEKRGRMIVGTIHSHPNWDAVLSPGDHKTHVQACHRITGLCSVLGNKTRVRYWVAESALHCKIEWANETSKNPPAPNAWRRR